MSSCVANGHPLRLLKKERECTIVKNIHQTLSQDGKFYIIEYDTGIGHGTAKFDTSNAGVSMMHKFLKLLERK